MNTCKSLFILLVGALALSGCSYRLGDFTALSSKNVPLHYDASTSARGKACKLMWTFSPGPPDLKDAVDQAIGTRGNALVNEVTYTSLYYAFIGYYACYEVKGDVVTIR